MSRAVASARLEGGARDTSTVAPRAKNLKPITKAVYWEELPTLPNDTSTQPPLEFDVLNPRRKRGA